jgi:alpha-beta hydrolase superfamily lysophospholipase
MTISADIAEAIDGCELVQPGPVAGSGHTAAMFRRGSVQPSRRAVLYVHAFSDPAVSPELVSWYTERAFQFYLAEVRLPARQALPGQRARSVRPVFADLDAAFGYLREAEGMDTIVVTARGRGACAAALWAQARQPDADALILHAPALPARRGLKLSIPCPVLVLTSGSQRPDRPALLGSHVTWLQLPGTADRTVSGEADPHELVGQLGRWLGAYMYGQMRDQLL